MQFIELAFLLPLALASPIGIGSITLFPESNSLLDGGLVVGDAKVVDVPETTAPVTADSPKIGKRETARPNARRSGGSSDTNSSDSDVSGPLTLQDFLKTGYAPFIPFVTGPLIGKRTGGSIGADVMTLEKDVMDVVARGADDIVGRAAPHKRNTNRLGKRVKTVPQLGEELTIGLGKKLYDTAKEVVDGGKQVLAKVQAEGVTPWDVAEGVSCTSAAAALPTP